MARSQRVKGAGGEREFAKLLCQALGHSILRRLGQARDGGGDILCGPLVFEVKRRHRIAAVRWIEQVRHAAAMSPGLRRGGVVAMREDGGEWMVLLSAKLFLDLAAEEIKRLWPEEDTCQ